MKKTKPKTDIRQLMEDIWALNDMASRMRTQLQRICHHAHLDFRPKANQYYCLDCDLWLSRKEGDDLLDEAKSWLDCDLWLSRKEGDDLLDEAKSWKRQKEGK